MKANGREIATRVFDRRANAVGWEQDQYRRLRVGEWVDPKRGRAPLSEVASSWFDTRGAVKRRTRETDESVWRGYIEPRFGSWPVGSLTTAEIAAWVGSLVQQGAAPASATRALATLRLILGHAVADERLTRNVAMAVKAPRRGARREGRALTLHQVQRLFDLCSRPYNDLVLMLALSGWRWGEVAGLQVADIVAVPGPGIRVRRAMLASNAGGALYVDSVKGGRARTVPLVADLRPIVSRWASAREQDCWLFHAPNGGPLRESNWKRSVR